MPGSSEDKNNIGALVVIGAAVGALMVKALGARARRKSMEYQGGYYQPPERRPSGLKPSDPDFYSEGWSAPAVRSGGGHHGGDILCQLPLSTWLTTPTPPGFNPGPYTVPGPTFAQKLASDRDWHRQQQWLLDSAIAQNPHYNEPVPPGFTPKPHYNPQTGRTEYR